MTRQPSWDFFLAHAGPDKKIAEALYDLLLRDCRVFLDVRSLRLGDDWDVELAKAQRDSLVSVVLVSAHTGGAYYQREEVAAAIALARQNPDSHRVVPLYIDSAHENPEVPYGLTLKHGIAIGNDCTLEDAAAKLLALRRSLRGGAEQEAGSTESSVRKSAAPTDEPKLQRFDLERFVELRGYAYSTSGLNLSADEATTWAEAKIAQGLFDLARFKQLRDYAYSTDGLNMDGRSAIEWADAHSMAASFDFEEFKKLRAYAYSASGLNLSATDATGWAERQVRSRHR